MTEPALTPKKDASADTESSSIGRRVYSFLLDPDIKGNLQRPVENFIAWLIILNVCLMLLETIPQVYEPYAKLFHFIDTVSIIIFTIEYVVRFALSPYQKDFAGKRFPRFSYAISPFAVIDLLSIVWPSRYGGEINKFFDLFIIFWVLLSVLSVLLETVTAVHYILALEFAVMDSIAVGVFTTEYLMRMYSVVEDPKFKAAYAGRAKYAFTPGAIIDAIAVLPFFLEALLHHLFDLRFLRIFRMMRLLKLTRFSDATKLVWDGIKREAGTIGASFFVMLLVIIVCGAVGYLFEHAAQPDKIDSIPTSIYWSVITLGSVGYGDISPITPMGRIVASLMALLGIALIAIPSGILAAAFTDQLRIEREKIGAKIAEVMEDDHIDPDEKAQLEADARRLHITHLELDEMIKVAKARKMQEQALRREFNLNAAHLDPRLALEQIRGIVEQMKVIVQVSDEKLALVMGSSDSPTNLEKRIFQHIVAEQRAAQAKPD